MSFHTEVLTGRDKGDETSKEIFKMKIYEISVWIHVGKSVLIFESIFIYLVQETGKN